jgi:hypothetical protein
MTGGRADVVAPALSLTPRRSAIAAIARLAASAAAQKNRMSMGFLVLSSEGEAADPRRGDNEPAASLRCRGDGPGYAVMKASRSGFTVSA